MKKSWLLVVAALLPIFVSAAEPEPYACGYAEGGRDGVVTVTVAPAGGDVHCKIDVRGEVTAPLTVEVTLAPTEPRP